MPPLRVNLDWAYEPGTAKSEAMFNRGPAQLVCREVYIGIRLCRLMCGKPSAFRPRSQLLGGEAQPRRQGNLSSLSGEAEPLRTSDGIAESPENEFWSEPCGLLNKVVLPAKFCVQINRHNTNLSRARPAETYLSVAAAPRGFIYGQLKTLNYTKRDENGRLTLGSLV